MNRQRYPMLLSIACAALAGCISEDSSTSSSSGSATYPAVQYTSGDWYLYESTRTNTLPSVSTTNYSYVREFRAGSAEQYQRILTYSDPAMRLTSQAYSSGGLLSSLSNTSNCTYSPPYRSPPPPGNTVGQAYSMTSTQSCVPPVSGSGTPSTSTSTVNGSINAIEERTVPAGTFQTFKYTMQSQSVSTTGISAATETCWIDASTGHTVECSSSSTFTPANTSSLSSSSSFVMRMVAYGAGGRAPVGDAVRRFAGAWTASLSGDDSGTCSSVIISASGAISASCTSTAAGAFTLTGNVSADGTATAVASNGASLTGSFTSPSTGSGTWRNGTLSGTWSATHR